MTVAFHILKHVTKLSQNLMYKTFYQWQLQTRKF